MNKLNPVIQSSSPISFCTSHGSSYKHSVPMLCPSNGDFLAMPLLQLAMYNRSLYLLAQTCDCPFFRLARGDMNKFS